MPKSTWFEVDRDGLAQTVRRRHPGFIFAELIANALDQPDTEQITVLHSPVIGRPMINLVVTDDDVTGFANLEDAYTLFRRTPKRADANVRGRFNLGEKEFLSICEEAQIKTTLGTVFFNSDGTRRISRRDKDKLERGTQVTAKVKMTRDDYEKALVFLAMIIPPDEIEIEINGPTGRIVLAEPKHVGSFEATLPTEIENEDGDLRRSSRKTRVEVSVVRGDRPAWLYEMGIPVCEIAADKWDINVMQKVPLARDRDSVTPGYLEKLRVAVLNQCHDELGEDDVTEAWVTQAISNEEIDEDAFKAVMDTRFGDDAVVFDPSDREANHQAHAHDVNVIFGGSLPGGAHANLKKFDAVPLAGSVFPTSKAMFGPDGDDTSIDQTPPMQGLNLYTEWLARELMEKTLHVRVVNSKQGYVACYGSGNLFFNLRLMSKAWVKNWTDDMVKINELIIHEFAHEYEESHLSEKYHDACCKLGAKLAQLVFEQPEEYAKMALQSVES